MIQEMLNIGGIHVPAAIACKYNKKIVKCLDLDHFQIKNIALDDKLYTKRKLDEELQKEAKLSETDLDNLDDLTPSDVRLLIKTEDELSHTRNWTRLVPSSSESLCLPLTYSDRLLQAWELRHGGSEQQRAEGRDRLRALCEAKHHLVVNTSKVTKEPKSVATSNSKEAGSEESSS